jgi:hypothetical protein
MTHEPDLQECIERLKFKFNVDSDRKLAAVLGTTPANLSNYKQAGHRGFPYKWFIMTSRKFGLSIDWVLYGDINSNQKGLIMVTKETLLTASASARKARELGREYLGVLTSDEAALRAELCSSVSIISDGEYFFFTDDHCFGVGILNETNWSPCTSTFPQRVVPRTGLEDGWINTVEKYIAVFCKDLKQISSIDELVVLLNSSE